MKTPTHKGWRFFYKKKAAMKLLPRLLLFSSNFTLRSLLLALGLEGHLAFRPQPLLPMPRADPVLRLLSNPRIVGRQTLEELPAECF